MTYCKNSLVRAWLLWTLKSAPKPFKTRCVGCRKFRRRDPFHASALCALIQAHQKVQQLRREYDALQDELAAVCAQRDEAIDLAQQLDDRVCELEALPTAAAPPASAPADLATSNKFREERDIAIGERFQMAAQLKAAQAEGEQLKAALASTSAALARSTQVGMGGDESPSAGGPTRADLEMVCSVMTTEQLKEDLVQSKLALSISRSQLADTECARSDLASELVNTKMMVAQLQAACENADALRAENAQLKAALQAAQLSAAAAARARGGPASLHAPTPTETSSPIVGGVAVPSDPPTPSRLARASSSSAEEGGVGEGGVKTSPRGGLGGMMRFFGVRGSRVTSPAGANAPPPFSLAAAPAPSTAAADGGSAEAAPQLPPAHTGQATAQTAAPVRRSLHRRGSGRGGSGFSDAESSDGEGTPQPEGGEGGGAS